jgi:biopolymer transport protein ExbD
MAEQNENTTHNDEKRNKPAFPAMRRVNKSVSRDIEQVELDLTPVMNLFMVLIPFLVAMAVFTHIAVININLPPASSSTPGATGEKEKQIDISIIITDKGFRIAGTGKKLDPVPKKRGDYDYTKLRALLKAVKFQYPSQKSVVLVIESDVIYNDIIKFMDVCRESQLPDIGLSGGVG